MISNIGVVIDDIIDTTFPTLCFKEWFNNSIYQNDHYPCIFLSSTPGVFLLAINYLITYPIDFDPTNKRSLFKLVHPHFGLISHSKLSDYLQYMDEIKCGNESETNLFLSDFNI